MNDQTEQEITEKISLGQALSESRVAAGLSVEDIALKLNLKISVIKNIENNLDQLISDGVYSTIYLRGYLANYSKEIGLKNLASFTQYQQLSHPEKTVKSLKNPHLISNKKKSANKLVAIILFLFVVAIGAIIYVWNTSVDRTNHQEESNREVANAVMQLPDNAQQTEQVLSEDNEIEPITDDVNPIAKEELEDSSNLDAAEMIEPVISELVDETEITTASEEIEQAVETSAEVIHSLTLKFKDECWTEVEDANGERLAFDLYQSGEELTLAGTPPFNLKLGNPSAVDVFYQDELVEKTFKSGQTTRFTLPE